MPKPKNALQERWHPVLFPHHKHQWHKAYRRIRTRLSSWKSEYGLELEDLILEIYGSSCCYCGAVLKVKTMSLDHKIPRFRDGSNDLSNVEIICKKCNVRKGILTKETYKKFLSFISDFDEVEQKYFLRKMGSKDMYGNK
jgi:5-methylcytosine-specific restriction endonuclease McrA